MAKSSYTISSDEQIMKDFHYIISSEKKRLSRGNDQCPYFTLSSIFDNIKKNEHSDEIMKSTFITTPCFDSDSFGNTLSNYIESRICSNITGYHFLSIFSDMSIEKNPFSVLPEIIYNPEVRNKKNIKEVKNICQCTSICHGKCACIYYLVDSFL